MVTVTQLIAISVEVLNEKGQEIVREHLSNDDMERAKIVVLGALDHAVVNKLLTDAEAASHYQTLGISPDKASRIRQGSARSKQ